MIEYMLVFGLFVIITGTPMIVFAPKTVKEDLFEIKGINR